MSKALVRRPGPRLADGLVTHIARRAVDPALSTFGPKHLMIRPWHPFTKESQHAVTQARDRRHPERH